MAFSYTEYAGDGVTRTFTFGFTGPDKGYIRDSDIVVLIDGIEDPNFQLTSNNSLEMDTAPADGSLIHIRRVMPKEAPYTDFQRGNKFGEDNLNNSFLQTLYTVHEFQDGWFPEGFAFLSKPKFPRGSDFLGADIDNAGVVYAQDIVVGPLELSASEVLDEAYNWAQYPYESPVPEGDGSEFSAYHYSVKADNSFQASDGARVLSETARDESVSAKDSSISAATSSESSREGSEAWAIHPEDTPVPVEYGGDGVSTFSALHWARKAELGSSGSGSSGFIAGMIMMWSGSTSSVPAGWALCDGENGTPDLTDRFIVGAGASYGVGDTGGSNDAVVVEHGHTGTASSGGSHTHTANADSAGSHNHTASTNTAGAHTHNIRDYSSGGSDLGVNSYGLNAGPLKSSSFIGSGGAHSHTVSIDSNGAHTHSVAVDSGGSHTHGVSVSNSGESGIGKNRPPYYALAFIIRL